MGFVVISELCRVSMGLVTGLGVSLGLTVSTIQSRGTLAQQERWLPGLVTYEKIGAWAITEPDSGSDAFGGMKSYVTRDGDDYILNGQKTFITNGPDADVVVVYAKLDEGDGADKRNRKVLTFVLDRGMEGFEQSKPFRKMGIHSSRTGELFFNNVRLGRDRLLGETEGTDGPDEGRASARSNFSAERIGVAAMALGVIEECLRLSVDYAKTRTLWGQEISQFQLIQLKLANMEVARMNVRNMLFRVIESGEKGGADLPRRGLCDQVVLLAGRHRRRHGGSAAVRRQRLHDRVPGGAVGPRCQVVDDLRRQQRGADHPRGTRSAQLAHGGQRVDLHQHDLVREVDEYRCPAWKLVGLDVLGDELAVHVIHGREVFALGEVDPEHQDIVDTGAARRQDRLDVLQRATGLRPHITLTDVGVGGGVHRTLARHLQESALTDALAEGVGRRRCVIGTDDLGIGHGGISSAFGVFR